MKNGPFDIAKSILRQASRLPMWSYLPARIKSLAQAAGNPPLYPSHLQIEPTKRCNLRCVMCAPTYLGRERVPDMSFDTFKKILVQIPGVQRLSLNGVGEPLLNRDLLDMIEFAREKGIYTRFNTNFTYAPNDAIERLVACGHSEVTISIETMDPETYADIRRGAALDTVIGNLTKLIECKKRHHSSTPKLIVYSLLMKCILPHIRSFVERCRELGAEQITFTDVSPESLDLDTLMRDGSRLRDNLLPRVMPEKDIWALLAEIKSMGDDHLEIVVPGDYGGLRGGHKENVGILTCQELWEMPFITCDGYVTPCCWASHPNIFNMGNLSEKSFEDIWFGPAYRRLRLQHILNRHPAHCARCQQLVCTAATPSRAKGAVKVQHPHTKSFLFR